MKKQTDFENSLEFWRDLAKMLKESNQKLHAEIKRLRAKVHRYRVAHIDEAKSHKYRIPYVDEAMIKKLKGE